MNSYGRIFNSSESTVSICQPNIEPVLIGTEYFDYTYSDCDDPFFSINCVQSSIQSYGNNIFTLSNPYRKVPLYYYEPNNIMSQTSYRDSSANFAKNSRIKSGSIGQGDLLSQQPASFFSINQFYDETSKFPSQNQVNQNHQSLTQYQFDHPKSQYFNNPQNHKNDDQMYYRAHFNKAPHQIKQNNVKNQIKIEYPHYIQNSQSHQPYQQPLQQGSSHWQSIKTVENKTTDQNLVSTSLHGCFTEHIPIKTFSTQNVLVDNGPQPIVQPALNALIKPSTESDFYYTEKYKKKGKKSKIRRPGNPEVIAEFIEVLDQTSAIQDFNIVEEKNKSKQVDRVSKDKKRIAYRYCDYYDSSDCYQSSSYKSYPVKTRYFDYTKNDYDSGFETYDKYSI
jgi:hypothetical protein